MKRWGEICRINFDNRLYILSASKIFNTELNSSELNRTWLTLEISTKTARKTRDKKLSKLDMKYSLIKSKKSPVILVKQIFSNLQTYVNTFKPETFVIGYYGYGREQMRRERLYNSIMQSLNYTKIHTEGNYFSKQSVFKLNEK